MLNFIIAIAKVVSVAGRREWKAERIVRRVAARIGIPDQGCWVTGVAASSESRESDAVQVLVGDLVECLPGGNGFDCFPGGREAQHSRSQDKKSCEKLHGDGTVRCDRQKEGHG